MKKQLNVDLVQNELRGGSAFFPGYKNSESEDTSPPSPPSGAAASLPPLVPAGEPSRPASDRATARPPDEATARPDTHYVPGRGELIRRGFEWYADQLRALKKLSLKEQLEGKPGSMSAMVRDALDEYLKKRKIPQ